MNKPHKHADLIKAWADGAEIEWKGIGMNTGWKLSSPPGWHDSIEYRIKPERKTDYKSIRDFINPIYNIFQAEFNSKVLSLVGKKISFTGMKFNEQGHHWKKWEGVVKSIKTDGEVPFQAHVTLEDGFTYTLLEFSVYD